MNFPFEKQTDAAGHNVLGLTFDRPIPWPVFDGGQESGGPKSSVAERIAAALDAEQTEAQVEHERAEKFLGAAEDAFAALDPLTDADGHLALAVQAAGEALDALRLLLGQFAVASQIISDARPGATGVREARAAALAVLFDDKTVSLLVKATAAAGGAREHAQRGSNVVSSEARNLGGIVG